MKPHSVLFRSAANAALFASLVLLACGFVFSQTEKPAPHGTVERVQVHGKSLEGNLEGDSPDRDVSIYLPPSYEKQKHRRYPVVYLLHGYMDNDDNWFGAKHVFINAPAAIDAALAAGSREMIFVMPSAHTVYFGSMYSNSVTTGDWEDYIAQDLVSYIDAHYRTIPDRMSRGLAGHSMGGYGTIRLAMKHPEVFSSIYWLSACCLTPISRETQGPAMTGAESVRSAADLAKAGFGERAMIAEAAAWSPNPANPPLFFDAPVERRQAAAPDRRKMGRECTARDDRPIHHEPERASRHRGRRGHERRTHGVQWGSRSSAHRLWNHAHVRNLRGHAHQRNPGTRGEKGRAVFLEQSFVWPQKPLGVLP